MVFLCLIFFNYTVKIIFFKENDVTVDVMQCESSSIKRYASAFSNTSI